MRRLIFFTWIFGAFSLRNLRHHLGRALMVVTGIALGAAVFTSVRISVHASLSSFSRSMEMLAGAADKVVIQPGGYVPENLIPILQQHPAVKRLSPVMTTYVRASSAQGDAFMLIGIDPILDRSFRGWRISGDAAGGERWTELMVDPNTLIIGEPLARELGVAPGTLVQVEHTRGTRPFRVLAILEQEGLALVEGGRVAITDIATFQEFTGLLGVVDRIDLILARGISLHDLDQFTSGLPRTVELHAPSAARDSGTAMIRAYQLNLSVLSFTSLFVGMFLVYSLVALNATARRRELAILRALGVSPGLLLRLFLAEGIALGLVGWLLAIPLSTIMVKHLLKAISSTISTLFVRVQPESLSLSPAELLLSFGVTVGVALVAACQPAREAMAVPPQEAMEIAPVGSLAHTSASRLALAALLCIAACLPLSLLPGLAGVPLPGYLAILLLFVGFSLLAPWMLQGLGRVAAPGLKRAAGVAAYLAGRYVRVSGTRTSVSVGALITAVALFTSLVIMIHSFRRTVELWVQQTVSGDLFVTSKMGQLNRYRFALPEAIVTGLRQLASETDYVPSRRFQLSQDGFPYEFEALGLATFLRHGGFVWLAGDPESARPLLVEGEGVLVSEVFANRTGIGVGDRFRSGIGGSQVDLPVLGIVRDYRTDGGIVFYDWTAFKERYHDPGWSGVRFYLGERAGLDDRIIRLRGEIAARYGDRLDMVNGNALRQAILKIFDETFAVTTVLLLIALTVAALGIATTLSVLVLERRRQLNTMAAVGASFGQIRSMIFWEAAFLVAVGEAAGLACGFILSYLLVYVINRQSFGWTFIYTVDWAALALSLPLIVMTALTAAIPAARALFREPPATIMRDR